jgi:PAS domain S-box-containing protein
MDKAKTKQQLLLEIEELRTRLDEAEETLRAIRSGEVDALVVSGTQGDQIYTLQGADRSYRIFLETMEEGAANLSNDGTILYCNRRLATMLATPIERVTGSSIKDYLSPADWLVFEKLLEERKEVGRREFDLRTMGGNRVPALLSLGILPGTGMPGFCLTAADLTGQKRVEEALRTAHAELEERVKERTKELSEEIEGRKRVEQALQRSHDRMRLASEAAQIGVWDWDVVSGRLVWDNKTREIFGVAPESPISYEAWLKTLHPTDVPIAEQAILDALAGRQDYEVEFRIARPDGAVRWIHSRGKTFFDDLRKPIRMSGLAFDVTARKQAEEELRKSEQRERERAAELAALLDAAPIPVFIAHDPDCLHITGNRAADDFLRHPHGAESSLSAPAAIRPRHFKAFRDGRELSNNELPAQRAARGVPVQDFEFSLVFEDGTPRHVVGYGTPLRDEKGQPRGAVNVLVDITERKKMEEELQRSRNGLELRVKERTAETYRQAKLLDLAHDAILVNEMNGVITFWNKGATEMYGWGKEEALGKIIYDLLKTKFPISRDKIVTEVIQKGRWEGQLTQTRKDGKKINVLSRWALQIDEEGRPTGIMVINRDITQRLLLEEQLRQAQKLEAIGTLTGGIAHDFNNILGAVVINSEMALLDLPGGSGVRSNLNLILQSGLRGKDLVRQMLLFSRKSEKKQEALSLTPLIKETFKLLRSSLPTTIQMELLLETDSDAVCADPSQIQQVIVNLCTNAAYAMRGTTGSIDISLQGITFGPNDLPESDMQPGDYLVLSVKDTGCGMDEEVKRRIFEPFFTTKPVGKGTGLGLSVVFGIIKDHRGGITVYSEPGKGSIFKVYLPRVDTGISAVPETPSPIPRGNERILLVDDEESNIKTFQNMLQHLGYQVTALMDSQEALTLFSGNPSQFDLVITDQTMPFMTGEDLGRELMRIRPDIPIILCTGYSDLISSEEATKKGFRDFIMKPFTVREGAELVRRVLDEKGVGNK